MGALLVTCEGMMDCVRLWLRIKGTDHEPQRPTDHVRPRTFCFACYSPPLSPLISCHHYCNNWLKTYKNKKAVYSVTKNTLCKNCTCACMHVSASCPLVICKPHHNHIITAWVDKIVKVCLLSVCVWLPETTVVLLSRSCGPVCIHVVADGEIFFIDRPPWAWLVEIHLLIRRSIFILLISLFFYDTHPPWLGFYSLPFNSLSVSICRAITGKSHD